MERMECLEDGSAFNLVRWFFTNLFWVIGLFYVLLSTLLFVCVLWL